MPRSHYNHRSGRSGHHGISSSENSDSDTDSRRTSSTNLAQYFSQVNKLRKLTSKSKLSNKDSKGSGIHSDSEKLDHPREGENKPENLGDIHEDVALNNGQKTFLQSVVRAHLNLRRKRTRLKSSTTRGSFRFTRTAGAFRLLI